MVQCHPKHWIYTITVHHSVYLLKLTGSYYANNKCNKNARNHKILTKSSKIHLHMYIVLIFGPGVLVFKITVLVLAITVRLLQLQTLHYNSRQQINLQWTNVNKQHYRSLTPLNCASVLVHCYCHLNSSLFAFVIRASPSFSNRFTM